MINFRRIYIFSILRYCHQKKVYFTIIYILHLSVNSYVFLCIVFACLRFTSRVFKLVLLLWNFIFSPITSNSYCLKICYFWDIHPAVFFISSCSNRLLVKFFFIGLKFNPCDFFYPLLGKYWYCKFAYQILSLGNSL